MKFSVGENLNYTSNTTKAIDNIIIQYIHKNNSVYWTIQKFNGRN